MKSIKTSYAKLLNKKLICEPSPVGWLMLSSKLKGVHEACWSQSKPLFAEIDHDIEHLMHGVHSIICAVQPSLNYKPAFTLWRVQLNDGNWTLKSSQC